MCALLTNSMVAGHSIGSYHELSIDPNDPNDPLPYPKVIVARDGSRDISCPANKSKRSNPTLNKGGNGEEKKNFVKRLFSKNVCRKLSEN